MIVNEIIYPKASYFSDVQTPFLPNHPIALCGRRNTGKTTWLLKCFQKYEASFDGTIVIIDSATEHMEKSLLRKISKLQNDSLLIDSSDEAFHELFSKSDETDHMISTLVHLLRISSCKIILIDVSFYLEQSYQYTGEKRQKIRWKYKKFAESCLIALDQMKIKTFVLMDEIELTEAASCAVQRMAYRHNPILASIHDRSYVQDASGIEIVCADEFLLAHHRLLRKDERQLCGNACAEIASMLFYCKDGSTRAPLSWCADIALWLFRQGIRVQLMCWNSRLYHDYHDSFDDAFDGFRSLQAYEKIVSSVQEKPFNADICQKELQSCYCMICCVDSALFHHDDQLHGGHFVLIFQKDSSIYCLNPMRTVIAASQANIEHIAKSCATIGAWRILCR